MGGGGGEEVKSIADDTTCSHVSGGCPNCSKCSTRMRKELRGRAQNLLQKRRPRQVVFTVPSW